MAKKKKNQNSRTSPVKTPTSRTRKHDSDTISNQKDTEHTKQDAIVLTIISVDNAPKKNNRSITQANDRIIVINENDAKKFDVNQGEEVLLLQVKGTAEAEGPAKVLWKSDESQPNQPLFASICRVAVSQNQNSFSSPNSGSATKIKASKEGEAHILPLSLSNKINSDPSQNVFSDKPNQSEMSRCSSDRSIAVKNPVATPSPAKPRFTFETFVTSPANSNRTTPNRVLTPQNTPKKKIRTQIAVLSLEKNAEVFQRLTTNAECLTLHLENSINQVITTDVLKKSEQVLKHLVQALCRGIYVSSGDLIKISFQGKKIDFKVQNIQSNSDHLNHSAKELTSSLQRISLNDKIVERGDDGQLRTSEEIAHQIRDNLSSPALFRINNETRFKFDFGETKEESANGNEKQTFAIDVTAQASKNRPPRKIVSGLDDVREQIHSFLVPALTNSFASFGIRPPKGVLLHGNSGCGKTLLAQQIALDIQNYDSKNKMDPEIAVDIVHVNCANIQASTSIMGNAEKLLTKTFEKAEKKAAFQNKSTLLIMDDIHLICPRRGAAGGGNGVERVASTLLALLDGIGNSKQRLIGKSGTKHGNIAILAITANPSLLDPALRRAGRLDTEVEIPSPDENTKIEIFSQHLNKLRHEKINVPSFIRQDLVALARLAKGFTGADCALSVKEATRCAILRQVGKIPGSPSVDFTYTDIQQAIRRTKPSSIKSITVEIPRVPWSSIGGMESVKRSLREAIELPLTHSHLFTALCIPPPRGVLLYGPPGCSKTLMARALATEGNMNFLAVKGPELLSKWLGESERALADLFRRARLASPCVIFFDEIDAIASKRGSGESSGGERMLSQLLTELDGVTTSTGINNKKSNPRVVVVGATNRPDLLDAALMRPGRIDRMIYVGIPDEETRNAIFMLQLKGKPCSPHINVSLESKQRKNPLQIYCSNHLISIMLFISFCRYLSSQKQVKASLAQKSFRCVENLCYLRLKKTMIFIKTGLELKCDIFCVRLTKRRNKLHQTC